MPTSALYGDFNRYDNFIQKYSHYTQDRHQHIIKYCTRLSDFFGLCERECIERQILISFVTSKQIATGCSDL